MSTADEYARELVDAHPPPTQLREVWDRDNSLVVNRREWLADRLTGKAKAVARRTPMVVAPTGQLNACATLVPGSRTEAVILLELRLTILLEFIVDLGFSTIFSDDEVETDAGRVAVAQALCDIYALPVLNRGPFRCPSFVSAVSKDQGLKYARALAITNALTFIMCHELAHIFRGHLGRAGRATLNFGHEQIDILNYDQRLELEADSVGFELLHKIKPDYASEGLDDPGIVFAAPFFVCAFFGALDHIHSVLESIATETSEYHCSDTHPHGFVRFDQLFKRFSPIVDEASRTLAVRFFLTVAKSLEKLPECDIDGLTECVNRFRP